MQKAMIDIVSKQSQIFTFSAQSFTVSELSSKGLKMKVVSALTALMFMTVSAMAGQLSVTGQCQKEVTPDRVSVTITARALEKEPKVATAKVAAQYEKMRAEVKNLKLKDGRTSTSGFVVNQEWDYANNKRTLKGYSSAMSLTAETSEVSKAGEILDIATKLNVAEVSTPTTFLSADLAKLEYEGCLANAITNAKSKAQKMANAAGYGLGTLAKLSETKEQTQPVPLYERSMQFASDEPERKISYESKPSTVEVTVFATYELK